MRTRRYRLVYSRVLRQKLATVTRYFSGDEDELHVELERIAQADGATSIEVTPIDQCPLVDQRASGGGR